MMEKLLTRFDNVEIHHEYLCKYVQPLGVKYYMGLVGLDETLKELDQLHAAALRSSDKELFGDSSNKLSWLIRPLSQLFPEAKFIHLVRDGRKVVSSFFHKLQDECYDDTSTAMLQAWVDNPAECPEPPPEKRYWWNLPEPTTPLAEEFRKYDQFERICFHWAEVNRVIIESLKNVDPVQHRTFKLEDLASQSDIVREMLEFLGLKYQGDDFEVMQRPHNVNIPRDFLLTGEQRIKFEKIAGSMMREFGYDQRDEYQVTYHPKKQSTIGETCDLCNGSQLQPMRRAPTSRRGLGVYLCQTCGLVQSLPRVDSVSDRRVAISSGADWGNVRYGKGFGTDAAMEWLGQKLDIGGVRHCLDVGSNRGSFVLKMLSLSPALSITAIEPDQTIVEEYCNAPGVDFKGDRIENVTLADNSYDLVYCSHTLEHLKSPSNILRRIQPALKKNGVLYIEVPNIEFIGMDDLVEEWFLDKHLYHFSTETLLSMVEAAGFKVDPSALKSDESKIALIARPQGPIASPDFVETAKSKDGCQQVEALIRRYTRTLSKNHQALQSAAREIENIARKKRVVVWGAGRIFDSLVRLGGLKADLLTGVVDKHLIHHVDRVHGCKLQPPKSVAAFNPQTVIIASRVFQNEIQTELQSIVPGCETIGFEKFLKETPGEFDEYR